MDDLICVYMKTPAIVEIFTCNKLKSNKFDKKELLLNQVRRELEQNINCPGITNRMTNTVIQATHRKKHKKIPITIDRPPHMKKRPKTSKKTHPHH